MNPFEPQNTFIRDSRHAFGYRFQSEREAPDHSWRNLILAIVVIAFAAWVRLS
jgi:hypothetical protein